MAKKVTVTLVDDFDGDGAADETVEFGLDGVTYEIDLSSKNAKKLRDDLSAAGNIDDRAPSLSNVLKDPPIRSLVPRLTGGTQKPERWHSVTRRRIAAHQ